MATRCVWSCVCVARQFEGFQHRHQTMYVNGGPYIYATPDDSQTHMQDSINTINNTEHGKTSKRMVTLPLVWHTKQTMSNQQIEVVHTKHIVQPMSA